MMKDEMAAAIKEYETEHEPRVEDSFILVGQIDAIHDLAMREGSLEFYSIVYGMMAGYSRGYKDGLKAAANKRTAHNLR